MGSHSGDGGGGKGGGGADDGDEDGAEDGAEDGDSLRMRIVASSSVAPLPTVSAVPVVPVVSGVPASPCVWSSCCSLTARTSPGSVHGRASPTAAGTSPTAPRHLRHSQTGTMNELPALGDRVVRLMYNTLHDIIARGRRHLQPPPATSSHLTGLRRVPSPCSSQELVHVSPALVPALAAASRLLIRAWPASSAETRTPARRSLPGTRPCIPPTPEC